LCGSRLRVLCEFAGGEYGGLFFLMAYEDLLSRYRDYLEQRSYSPRTIDKYYKHLIQFTGYLKERGVERVQDIQKDLVRDYQNKIHAQKRKLDGRPLSVSMKLSYLLALKIFFSFLSRKQIILYNPASDIDLPIQRTDTLRDTLKEREIIKILEAAKPKDTLSLRDRAILELFYSTGIRNTELRTLKLQDLDLRMQELTIREGKGFFGKRQRVLPVGRVATAFVEEYLATARPKLLKDKESPYLFITRRGRILRIEAPNNIIKKYSKAAGLKRNVHTHLLRHSFATHLLRHGADIRHVQEMLGHSSLESTKVYTKLEITDLKKIHSKSHPRERQ